MAIDKSYFRDLLSVLNFVRNNGSEEIWEKKYTKHNNYIIQIDFSNEKILYNDKSKSPKVINVNNENTSNFAGNENMVVLECVNRLLEKGYKPEHIELEKEWPSGHGTSGRLDILVNKDESSYLMIECKLAGKEFKKEQTNMLSARSNGDPKGQLFSYCFQEKTTEYMCLYASSLVGHKVKFENSIIQVEPEWRLLINQKEYYDHWNKMFRQNGIFESTIKPYNIECKALLRKDLKKLNNDDSSKIFNQFLEILRHNSVSDKPNAFNKILNLFICKIVDEERADNEELICQWKDDTSYVSLQSGLEDLYKQGMDKFLNIKVTDYSDNEIESRLFSLRPDAKVEIIKIFQQLRLQKNPEFAFKEVYNDESFEENAKVVKEVVQLLQPYQFRYGHKQQFLGNFFELLLNTSIKQESGQFFTPIPIARYMITSLPIKECLDSKIRINGREILPTMIDYACGSGHFLTEYMDITQSIINGTETSGLSKSIANTINKWKQTDDESYTQGEFEWAEQYVYGIEKDYRLVKTAKISTFLNGDGTANIIHADGIDKFSSKTYKGILKSTSKNPEQFDFVIANPPYAVSSFKNTLNSDSSDFEIYDLITDNESDIECMFVERTSQLLKEKGCASIILPKSILSNTNSATLKAKEILLTNFNIKAMSVMGSNTFMATGISTVILFLEKRNKNDLKSAIDNRDKFFSEFKEFSFNGQPHIINKYIIETNISITTNDYIEGLKDSKLNILDGTEMLDDYRRGYLKSKEFTKLKNTSSFKKMNDVEKEWEIKINLYNFIIKNEKSKMLYFLLTFDRKTVLIDTGEKDAEIDFLGFEFSNRRGSEGIHLMTDADKNIVSSLYDETVLNSNNDKVNYYILNSFLNKYPKISDELKGNVQYVATSSLVNFETFNFTIAINTKPNIKVEINSKYNSYKLGKYCDVIRGETITEKETTPGEIPVIAGGMDMACTHNKSNREGKIISVSGSGANAGYVNYWEKPIFASDCTTIKSNDENVLSTKFVYELLKVNQEQIFRLQKGKGQPHVYPESLWNIKIPIPDIDIQKSILTEIATLESKADSLKNMIITKKNEIEDHISTLYHKAVPLKDLSEIADVSRGASPRPIREYLTKDKSGINWIKIGDVSTSEKFISKTKQKITPNGAKKSVKVKKGDLIVSNSMSWGRPYIVGIDGCVHDGWLIISKKTEDYLTEYLYYVFSSQEAQRQFSDKAKGGMVENLNIPRVETLKVPDMDRYEQEKIVDTINGLENELSQLEKDLKDIEEEKRIAFSDALTI